MLISSIFRPRRSNGAIKPGRGDFIDAMRRYEFARGIRRLSRDADRYMVTVARGL